MRIEGRDLINLGQSEPHLMRQSGKMRRREMPIAVLNEMQMLDQEIAAALAVAKQRAYFLERLWVDLTALWRAWRSTSSYSAMTVARRVLRRLG
jgi:hypothetical protein